MIPAQAQNPPLLIGTDKTQQRKTEERKQEQRIEQEDINLLDDVQPIEVEMLVPSTVFMDNYEKLNRPSKVSAGSYKTALDGNEGFDCNPGRKDLVDSMQFVPRSDEKKP